MTKYVACWDYDDCASILFDLFYKESQSYKELHKFIADHRPHNIDSKKLIDAAHADMLALFNNSATEEPLTELSTCSLRANRYIDQWNLDVKSPKGYTADQRLLSNDLQMAENLDCFTATLSMLTMADVANAILTNSPLGDLKACALMEGTQYAFKYIEKSKFSMFVLISQYYKMRWPNEDIVIDVYDDQLANPKSRITEGVDRLMSDTRLLPEGVQMRFRAMDSYTLLYQERDGDEIAFVNSLKHFTSLENFKPFTSHHKLVKSINGTGKLLQHEALKKIARQCFKQPTPPVQHEALKKIARQFFKQPTPPVDLAGVSLDITDDSKSGKPSGLADAAPKSPVYAAPKSPVDAAPKSPVDATSKSPVDVCCITQPIHYFGIPKAATVPPQDQCGDGALPKEVGPPLSSETAPSTEHGFFASDKRRKITCSDSCDNSSAENLQLPK